MIMYAFFQGDDYFHNCDDSLELIFAENDNEVIKDKLFDGDNEEFLYWCNSGKSLDDYIDSDGDQTKHLFKFVGSDFVRLY